MPAARSWEESVPPVNMGPPHRFPYFGKILEHLANMPSVVFMTATQIHDWYVE